MRSLASFIIALAIVAILYFLVMPRAPDMLANRFSQKLGVAVSIDSIKPGLSTLNVNRLEIANEKGYTLPKIFSSKTIVLNAPLTTFFADQAVIEEVLVDDIYLGIEFDTTTGPSGNWSKLLSRYQKEAKLDASDGKKVLIKKLIFTNIQGDLVFKSEGGRITKLPTINRIELKNINTEGGNFIDQLTGSVLGQILIQAFMQYHSSGLLKELFIDAPSKAIELLIEPFKGIFNMAPKEAIELKHTA